MIGLPGMNRRMNHLDNFKKAYQALDLNSMSTELKLQKRDAFERFLKKGLPSRKIESWHYTQLQPYVEKEFSQKGVEKNIKPTQISKALSAWKPFLSRSIVFVNGVLSEEHSTYQSTLGLEVEEITDSVDLLGSPPSLEKEDALNDLNLALFRNGYRIMIKPDVVLIDPIVLFYIQSGSHQSTTADLHVNRNLIWAKRGSQVTVLEVFISLQEGESLVSVAHSVVVEEGAHLKHKVMQLESLDAVHLYQVRASVARDATYQNFILNVGSKLTRSDLFIALDAEGASAVSDALYLAKEKQQLDFYTVIKHNKPQTISSQLYKGILNDEARSSFSGVIRIEPQAQKSEGHQLNRNLLMSKKAEANSKPQLEIYADDVKCKHGSTLGQLNEEELFYFQARAISKAKAVEMMVRGFAKDLLYKEESDLLQKKYLEVFENWFSTEQTI